MQRLTASSFGFDTFLLFATAIVLIAIALSMSVQSDTWWLLRTGQLIVATRQVPTTESFSWTMAGGAWPNHEWLAAVLFYATYTVGGMRLTAALCAAAVVGAWTLVYGLMAGSGKVRVYALWAGIASQAIIWSVRPAVFSLFFTAVAITLLQKRRHHWWYPALFLIWANTHAGVAFGGVVLFVATVVSWWKDRDSFRHWLIILSASAAATLITPIGLGLWRLLVHSLSNPVLGITEEWLPPSPYRASSYPFLGLVIALLVAAWRTRASMSHTDWTLTIIALVFAGLGLKSLRHTAMFALVAPIVLSRRFSLGAPTPAFAPRQRLVHLGALATMALAGALFVHVRWVTMTDRPALGPDIVAALERCPDPLFNTYEVGGQIIWAVPGRRVFVDNRQDPYPVDLILAAKYVEATGDYRGVFEKFGARCAIMPAGGVLAGALDRAGWREAAGDQAFTVRVSP